MKTALLHDNLTFFWPLNGFKLTCLQIQLSVLLVLCPTNATNFACAGVGGWGGRGWGRCHVSVREKSPPKHLHSRCVMLYGQTDKHKR